MLGERLYLWQGETALCAVGAERLQCAAFKVWGHHADAAGGDLNFAAKQALYGRRFALVRHVLHVELVGSVHRLAQDVAM